MEKGAKLKISTTGNGDWKDSGFSLIDLQYLDEFLLEDCTISCSAIRNPSDEILRACYSSFTNSTDLYAQYLSIHLIGFEGKVRVEKFDVSGETVTMLFKGDSPLEFLDLN